LFCGTLRGAGEITFADEEHLYEKAESLNREINHCIMPLSA
jgi:hypothetical protein